ncbi:type II toxin-antitoxin system VapC family toxin [Nocardia donostiensis]|uniref:Ribonuclease VapC n=1 Tax=Nocardia donostiensis TaxID=1538463 RepID=A0A1W0AXZ8_9NOCA|nr:type II toxin-antitoxin system VapC family toxin [Nocardia donostiensis]ONM47552.1 hypothetical protein B0T46_16745 [Nocardia donostiensis]OQS15105.1 hypothetical protein B0T36_10560 [Nocardia donostiensis]OQS24278.1 hypothetical protein B0T44_01295 [Nocardia donostiensis]
MIIADTNVVSELFRAPADERVLAWLDANPTVGTTAITVGEVWAGIEQLPEGRRKTGFVEVAEDVFHEFFGDITEYGAEAARLYGRITAECRVLGRPISQGDAHIAAICLAEDAVLATRNVKVFTDLGLEIVNPWEW